jgi:hypothetical protein
MSFIVDPQGGRQGSMVPTDYLATIFEIQNTITSATGLSPIQQVQQEVAQLQTMVNFEQKRIFTNIISKFDQSPIQITDDINMSNSLIFVDGVLLTGGGGGGGGGTVVSSGGTSIILVSTTSAFSTAIAFDIGGRTVFSFNGAGQALYYDPLGTGNQFWISSANLIADRIQIGGAGLGAAPGKFLESMDLSGTGAWRYVSSLTTNANTGPTVQLSSSGILFRTGDTVQTNAGLIDSNRNWYLGLPSFTGNNDLAFSNDFTVIGGTLRYQGGGVPTAGSVLVTADSMGTVVLCNATSVLSTMIVGDQIQSGATSVKTDGTNQIITFTQGFSELARVTSQGRLGISNTSPQATLDVGGNAIISGTLTVNPAASATNYVFTATGPSGLGTWAAPTTLFTGTGGSLTQWSVNGGIGAIQGYFNGQEEIRLSSGTASFGITNPMQLGISGIVAAAGFASFSPLRFFIGAAGINEVGRFANNGNFGIGTRNPLYKLHVSGSQSNEGALFVSTNLQIGGNAIINGTAFANLFSGNGSNLTNIQTVNVGTGSNRLDVFQATTRADITALKISVSSISTSIYSTLNGYNINGGLGFLSTVSSYINTLSAAIGPGAGAVVSTYSTSVGIALDAQFSTLSSYIVENTVQFSTLSSVIQQVSFDDRAFASTVAYSTASTVFTIGLSTFLSTGGIFTGQVGFNYPAGWDLSGALDISGILYTRGIAGIQAPFSIGVGTSTTTQLVAGGWTPGIGWRYNVEGDVDISGRLFRNGQLYTVQGIPDTYWTRNGSDIYFNDGNVGIGVTDPSYPLDVAGRIRCFGVDVIPGPGPATSSPQGSYVSPWQYQGSNIYYNLGGVGIGTGLSSVSTGVFLDVSGAVFIRNGTTYMSTLGVNIPFGSTLTAAADIYGSLRALSLTVNSTGDFGGRVTARDFLSLSDRRYKTHIEPLLDAKTMVKGMRGVRFRWIDSTKTDVGLIAQEVFSVLPEAVSGDEESGYHVAYDKLVPVLLETVKDLQQRVEVLEKRLSETV